MSNLSKTFGLSCVAACLCFVGCGDLSVSGKVTLTDGTPVTTGKVYFEDGDFSATGDIQKDGSYRMGTVKDGSGVPPGHYKVAIMGALVNEFPEDNDNFDEEAARRGMLMRKPVIFHYLVHKKYTSVSTSGLTVDVKKSMKYDIVVEPPED